MALTALRRALWSLAVVLAAWGLAFGAGAAPEQPASTSRVPKPLVETGKGDKCVEDTQFMRRNHMKLLKHQRDETVHRGIRTAQHSLKGCIDCHASRKTGSVAASNENFCQTCHSYAAVTIDCFECHASKPAPGTQQSRAPSRATTREIVAVIQATP